MIRRLLFFLFVLWLLWLARAAVRLVGDAPRRRGAPGRERAPRALRSEGTMVRDRICNTFLPRAQALHLRRGGEDHFFCSETCRAKFLERCAG